MLHPQFFTAVVTPNNRAFCRFTSLWDVFESKGQRVLRSLTTEAIQNCAADVSDKDMLLAIQIFRNPAATSVFFLEDDCIEVQIRIPFLWSELKRWVLQCLSVYRNLPIFQWIGPEVHRRSFMIYADTEDGAGPTIVTTGRVSRRSFATIYRTRWEQSAKLLVDDKDELKEAPARYYENAYRLTDKLFSVDPTRPDLVESLTLGFSTVHLSIKDFPSWGYIGNSVVRTLCQEFGWAYESVEIIRGIRGSYNDFERRYLSSEALAA
jgi:hypothetical protein